MWPFSRRRRGKRVSDPKPYKRTALDLQSDPTITSDAGFLVVREERVHHYLDNGYEVVEDLAGEMCLVQRASGGTD